MVEGVESGAPVDLELKGLAGTGVENRDRDLRRGLVPEERDLDTVAVAVGEFPSVAKAVAVISVPPRLLIRPVSPRRFDQAATPISRRGAGSKANR
jgi:hypothetical protein